MIEKYAGTSCGDINIWEIFAVLFEEKLTNSFICLYTNRKGFQCIWSLFMTKNTNTLAPFFWLCKKLQLGYGKLLVFGET